MSNKPPNNLIQFKNELRIDSQVIGLDLHNETISGGIDDYSVLFSLDSLESLNLAEKYFNFTKIPTRFGSLASLLHLNLSNSMFSGQIPEDLSQLTRLEVVDLSSRFSYRIHSLKLENPSLATLNLTILNLVACNLIGTFPKNVLQLQKLQSLDLSINTNLNGSLPEFPVNRALQRVISLGEITYLSYIHLSSNKLTGQIPSFQLCKNLTYIDLSRNSVSGIIPSTYFQDLQSLISVDLRFNGFDGSIPSSLFSQLKLQKLQLCNNNCDGLIPHISTASESLLNILDLNNNKLDGEIPRSFFELRFLNILLLSSNNLSGVIESKDFQSNLMNLDLSFNNYSVITSSNSSIIQQNSSRNTKLDMGNTESGNYLIEFVGNLGVLNLGNNNLSGQKEGTFSSCCRLNTLDLHGNSLAGQFPGSLVNCTMLEVLNLGNNKINDTYPCFLGTNTNLRVLVLQSNMLQESVHCDQDQQNSISKLQILDIADSNFSGVVPPDIFRQWGAMLTDDNGDPSSKNHLSFKVMQLSDLYYQDSVTVIVKGFELELVKILTLFTSIDISSTIPLSIGIGHLIHLESLDMSLNKITREIPSVLTILPFLSGLCGFPLNPICTSTAVPVPSSSPDSDTSGDGNDWQTIFYGMGAGAGSLIVVAILCTLYKANTLVQLDKRDLFTFGLRA
ncbi:leucine-rich repeat domain, L domain-like protein [Artemisia annua]|uniref:Leucine-rich repeat domain, L domain-like protein n=1 Tax=Artemisia annua TaxID=35608 RepID=A0A2U1Q0N0_ARTAN|nr:leucine-rich repeat domain, L domain-like protein [Artemisia annua]